jgi:micrococcal nuclease
MIRLIMCALVVFGGLPSIAVADINWEQLTMGETSRVVEVVDGDTVVLDPPVNGAREVRLVGIQAPKIALGRTGFVPWPLGDEAKAALSALILGKDVTLYFGGRRMDRHGRLLAHLKTSEGVWAQGRMLRAGVARVYSFADNRSEVPAMLEQESMARAANEGIWAHPFYAVRTPETVSAFIGRYELVEGVALNVAEVKGRIYINFGEDWRDDFTITVQKKAVKLFDKAGVNLLSLTGRKIRVRGWVKSFNGPQINLTHPERLEILAP